MSQMLVIKGLGWV